MQGCLLVCSFSGFLLMFMPYLLIVWMVVRRTQPPSKEGSHGPTKQD